MRPRASGEERPKTGKLFCFTAGFVVISYAPFLAPGASSSLPGLMIFWSFSNWPLERDLVFGVPLLVLLLWPLQYVVFPSEYQAVSGRSLGEA